MVKLEKSKLSPKIVDIPCYIDVTAGGVIDKVESFVRYLTNPNINFIKTGSWYTIKDTIDNMAEAYPILKDRKEVMELRKSFRRNELYNEFHKNEDLMKLLEIWLIDFIDGIYPAQREVNGEYQKSLIDSCKYLKEDNDIDVLKEITNIV